jgi:hypothetical protein
MKTKMQLRQTHAARKRTYCVAASQGVSREKKESQFRCIEAKHQGPRFCANDGI